MEIKKKPRLHKSWIHPAAMEITQRLQEGGFKTYLVGGCVRDLLSGVKPKDFDIATTAEPREVKRIIPNSYIIGKRFRLVLAKRKSDFFEIATFRRDPSPQELVNEDISGDNFFGTEQEDALRRDFTINGLFYDPAKDELIDYCNGIPDIESQIVRMIGNPLVRLEEDPIRILRALRLSHKLDFSLECELRRSIVLKSETLKKSALPRVREELLKIFRLSDPSKALFECYDLGVFASILPTLNELYTDPEQTRVFNTYLKRLHSNIIDPENPLETFAYVILSYLRATEFTDPEQHISANDISDRAKNFFKTELGIFNVEQTIAVKALELQKRLNRIDRFEKRSKDSRLTFLKSDAFPLALILAKTDYSISPDKILYWDRQLEENWSKIQQVRSKKGRK